MRLISTRFGIDIVPAFLCEDQKYDYLVTKNIVVDVTPEKRYAIWNNRANRFTDYTYTEKTEAQIILDELNTGRTSKNYYVVEFDYPGESE